MTIAKAAFVKLKQASGDSTSTRISKLMKTPRWFRIAFAGAFIVAGSTIALAAPIPQTAGANVRVTLDNGSNGSYVSADQLAGGTYNDALLRRCGTDRRAENQPPLAIDPRDTCVWASGAHACCHVPAA